MQKIVLDVIPSGIRPRVYVNQYDIGREFQITFKEGLGEYYFANGTTIKINGKKADNHVFEYTQSDKWDSTHYIISTSGSGASKVVTIATAEQMTAAAGDADVQLTLQNSAGAVIGTLDFVMVVQARPSAAGDPSESDLPDIVRSVNNISPDANGNVQLGPVPGGIGAHNISTVEATRQMSTSYSAGDYVYVTADDQLYKITSPIGAGGTLTPGSNAVACQLTSDLAVIGGIISDYSSVAVSANTSTEVLSITIPKGIWIIVSFMDLSASINSTYNHNMAGRTVRSSGAGGGGSVNVLVKNVTAASESIPVSTYVSTAVTVRTTINAIRIR